MPFSAHSFLLNIIKDTIEYVKWTWFFVSLCLHMCKRHHRHSEEFCLRSVHALPQTAKCSSTLITWRFIVILSILCWITQWKLIWFCTDRFFIFFSSSAWVCHILDDVWCLKLQQFLGGIFCMEMLQSLSMLTWWWLLRFLHHPHCWLLTNTAPGWTLCTRIWKNRVLFPLNNKQEDGWTVGLNVFRNYRTTGRVMTPLGSCLSCKQGVLISVTMTQCKKPPEVIGRQKQVNPCGSLDS